MARTGRAWGRSSFSASTTTYSDCLSATVTILSKVSQPSRTALLKLQLMNLTTFGCAKSQEKLYPGVSCSYWSGSRDLVSLQLLPSSLYRSNFIFFLKKKRYPQVRVHDAIIVGLQLPAIDSEDVRSSRYRSCGGAKERPWWTGVSVSMRCCNDSHS